MGKNGFMSVFAALLLGSCSNPLEEAKEVIRDGSYWMLRQDIEFVNSTVEFVRHAVPENYWYRGAITPETTEVLMEDLEALEEEVEYFEYSGYDMHRWRGELLEMVRKTREGLGEILENPWAATMYYGMAGVTNLFGASGKTMPADLRRGIVQMDSVIRHHYWAVLPESMFQLERMAFGNGEITLEGFKELRAYTLQTLRDSLAANIYCENEEWEGELIGNVMKAFSEQYPVNASYRYLSKWQKYSGVLYRFVLVGEGDLYDYDNVVVGDCNWGYLFVYGDDRVIYRYDCFGADTVEYRLGRMEEREMTLECIFDKVYAHPSAYDTEDEAKWVEARNRGTLQESEPSRLELELCDCSQYPFMFKREYELDNGNRAEERYVLRLAPLEEYNHFVMGVLSTTKVLDGLFE